MASFRLSRYVKSRDQLEEKANPDAFWHLKISKTFNIAVMIPSSHIINDILRNVVPYAENVRIHIGDYLAYMIWIIHCVSILHLWAFRIVQIASNTFLLINIAERYALQNGLNSSGKIPFIDKTSEVWLNECGEAHRDHWFFTKRARRRDAVGRKAVIGIERRLGELERI